MFAVTDIMKTGRELRACSRRTPSRATNATRRRYFGEIVAASRPLTAVLIRIGKGALTDWTVLIADKTGTGKELIARTNHKESRRSNHSPVSANSTVVAPAQIPGDTFGIEHRMLTGTMQRRLPILAIQGVWR